MNDSTGGIQHGGDHYKAMGIQPIDYAEENKLTATEFSVVKYVSRHRHKAGMEDLKKAFHFLQMLARRYYNFDVDVQFYDRKASVPETDMEEHLPQHYLQKLLCSVLCDFNIKSQNVEVDPLDPEEDDEDYGTDAFHVRVRFSSLQVFTAIGYRDAGTGFWQLDNFEWLPTKKAKKPREIYQTDKIEDVLRRHGFFPPEDNTLTEVDMDGLPPHGSPYPLNAEGNP